MSDEKRKTYSDHECTSIEIGRQVLSLLNGHLTAITIDVSDQGIVMRGTCDSFHAKQLAEETVVQISNLRVLSNELIINETDKPFP